MRCPVCDSAQQPCVTKVDRKISVGEFKILNVPAMICENTKCNQIVIEHEVVKNMQLLRSKMIRGEVPFTDNIDYQVTYSS